MFKQLVSAIRGDYPLRVASESFREMLDVAEAMVRLSGIAYLDDPTGDHSDLYRQDDEVNRLEQKIKHSVVVNLSSPVPSDAPHGLLLLSLVRDAERIGDYAKNLAKIPGYAGSPPPGSAAAAELGEVRGLVNDVARQVGTAYAAAERDLAHDLTLRGRAAMDRCDAIVDAIGASEETAKVAVCVTLGARFYKRVLGHYMNILSSVLMPLHKLDHYDEHVVGQFR